VVYSKKYKIEPFKIVLIRNVGGVVVQISEIFAFSDNLIRAYERVCQPLCRKLQIPQTAFDILMFLANNPEYPTARDIVEIRKIKANLVSFHVEKLVKEGLLERRPLSSDRRKVILVCTPRAKSITDQGREMQQEFVRKILEGISGEDLQVSRRTISQIGSNAAEIIKKGE